MFTIIACIKYIRSELIPTDQQSENNYAINPYDLYMLEQLMELKKIFSCRIISITMGPPGCMEAIQRSIAMGLDEACLVSDPCFSGSDTYATSYVLNKALHHTEQADIYAFGEKAMDGETGQVPVGVASRLDLQCISGVKKLVSSEEGKIVLKRQVSDRVESVEVFTPCVLCFKGFTTREPQINLLKLKQSRKYSPIILNAEDLNIDEKYCGQNGSKTIVKNVAHTIHKRNVELLEGTPQLKADAFRRLILDGGRSEC